MFDSLKYAKILEESGLPRNQAETHVRVLYDVIGDEMATKADLTSTKNALEASIQQLRSDMAADFVGVKAEFAKVRHEMASAEHRIVYKLGGLMVALFTLSIAFVQMLNN